MSQEKPPPWHLMAQVTGCGSDSLTIDQGTYTPENPIKVTWDIDKHIWRLDFPNGQEVFLHPPPG